MKIIRTDTTTHTSKIVSFNEVYRVFFGKANRTLRIWLSCRMLDNVVLTDRNYEYKRIIN